MIRLGRATERALGRIRERRVEIRRQGDGACPIGVGRRGRSRPLPPAADPERTPVVPLGGGGERIEREQFGRRGAMRRERVRRRGPGRRQSLFLDMHLDLVGAEREPVAAAQLAASTAANRVGLAVQKRAVGRKIGDLPATARKVRTQWRFDRARSGSGRTQSFSGARPIENSHRHVRVSGATLSGQRMHRKRKRHPNPWRKPTLIKRDQPEAYRTVRRVANRKNGSPPNSAEMAETAGADIARISRSRARTVRSCRNGDGKSGR